MRVSTGLTFAVFLLLISPVGLVAGSLVVNQTIELQPEIWEYQIAAGPIVSRSEIVRADTLQLVPGLDYYLDYQRGYLIFKRLPIVQYVQIQYILIPPDLTTPYLLYQVLPPGDSLFSSVTPKKSPLFTEDGDLQISGSKTFAVTFSEADAFDLKQTLYVNLNGELARNVNIAAQLSDSQSKLTPEGDSKELSSLDKVFIRVYGKQYELAMGDLTWQFEGTQYINYQTNIEGINAWYKNRHFAQAGYTAASGKPAFLTLAIIDGKQGPYYLKPSGFQSTYIIVAGSEQIYRDGRLLERGQDYYIDYSDGSVMFRTLVVSSNSVNAYFNYTDEYYKQSTYFNSSRISLLPGLSLAHHFIHQVDSKDNPLLYAFGSADLDSLRTAGDKLVWGDGAVEVEAGEGSYLRRTTAEGLIYYEYVEADTSANYNVTFSYVGSGNGDYQEYSGGKFRWIGPHLGAWLPLKRLIPASSRTNTDLLLSWERGNLKMGVEGIYTANDKNTFSKIDDGNNLSGIIGAFGQLISGETERQSSLRLDFEKRWADSFLFTQYNDLRQEYDFSSLDSADSLGQTQLNLTLGTKHWQGWNPELTLRLKNIQDYYTQKALRFVSHSSSKGIFPAIELRSTISAQKYTAPKLTQSLLQYHELDTNWDFRYLKTRLGLNYSSLDYSEPTQEIAGNRYLKLNPQLSLGNPKLTFTQLSYSRDNTWLQYPAWNEISSSQTYALKHSTTLTNHTISLDLTHRELQKQGTDPKSNYDLITLRNSHAFLKQAILLLGNYQLNQTEFYPRIQELEYVGEGLGSYDADSLLVPGGGYDYTYITSDQGSLSSEINAQLSLFLKPGLVLADWKKLRSDIIVQATEQSSDLENWRSYIFYPGTVYNADSTIYGKQSYSQTLWLDLLPSKIIGSLVLEIDRSRDNRYQNQSRTYQLTRRAELDLKQYWGNNYNARYELHNETDSRYLSQTALQTLLLLIQRNLSTHTIVSLDLEAIREEGAAQNSSQDYSIRGLGFTPGYKGTWGKKGRASASLGVRFNDRSGTDFMTFLPEKRDGFLFNWAVSAIYRLNNFSSASLEYKGSMFPEEAVKHSLKLEFKAEL